MRRVLHDVISDGPPDHLGLAYEVWAPSDTEGKLPDKGSDAGPGRADWLQTLARIQVSSDYQQAYSRWEASFVAPGDRRFTLTASSRLLIGHGNTSAVDVGLTVHRAWGVPMIPGSSIKGLLAHYVEATHGPDDPGTAPWEQLGEEQERAEFQGVTFQGSRAIRGPGRIYRAIFGAPTTGFDDEMVERKLPAGAVAGRVCFHDALYVPGDVPDDRPFATDVLTVHQKSYYDEGGNSWPNDYGSPTPVAFLTVRPRVKFLFTLSGPSDWTELAERLLRDALEAWGIGGKTSAGYGRLGEPAQHRVPVSTGRVAGGVTSAPPAARIPQSGDVVEVTLLEERTKKGGWRATHEPTGLSGAIQNSAAVPESAAPGDRLRVAVAHANEREMAFKIPPSTPPTEAKGKGR